MPLKLDPETIRAENEKRFFANIPVRGHCWIWTGPVFRRKRLQGDDRQQPACYARNDDGKLIKVYAKRMAWYVKTGFWPSEEMWIVNHPQHCNDDLCVNFEHLVALPRSGWKQALEELGAKLKIGRAPQPQTDEAFLNSKRGVH